MTQETRPRGVLFDLDGTLIDSLEDLADSGNQVLDELGFPSHPLKDYRIFVGEGVETLVARILPSEHRNPATIADVVARYRSVYALRWDQKTDLYDGIAPMLDSLTEKQVRLGVLSNKPHTFTARCVERLLSAWAFDPAEGQREGVPIKPDPTGALRIVEQWSLQPQEVLFIGDTSIDMETAVSAGMIPVGVTWGFRSQEELQQHGARLIIHHPMQLLDSI